MKIMNWIFEKKKEKLVLRLIWFFLCILGMALNYVTDISESITYSTTSYAFSYLDYGFSSRMLLGTVYQLIGKIIPSIIGWKGCYIFMLILLALMDISILMFCEYILDKFEGNKKKNIFILCIVAMTIVIMSFSTESNFGKTDTFLFILGLIQAYLIIEEKNEWLVPILSLLQVMTHEGFLCMTANVSICLLAYKGIVSKSKMKYWSLFALNLVLICGPAVYFVFFKTPGTEEIFLKAQSDAANLNKYKGIHYGYLLQRINYSVDLPSDGDSYFKANEISQLPLALAMFSPYIYLFIKQFVVIVKDIKHKISSIVLFVIAFILVLVEFYIFCDFGRYFVWLFFFSFIYIVFLYCENNSEVKDKLIIKDNIILLLLMYAYLLLLMPLESAAYSRLVSKVYSLF